MSLEHSFVSNLLFSVHTLVSHWLISSIFRCSNTSSKLGPRGRGGDARKTSKIEVSVIKMALQYMQNIKILLNFDFLTYFVESNGVFLIRIVVRRVLRHGPCNTVVKWERRLFWRNWLQKFFLFFLFSRDHQSLN